MESLCKIRSIFYRELRLYVFYSLSCAYLSISIIYLYLNITGRLWLYNKNTLSDGPEWDIINVIIIIFISSNTASIISNIRIHYGCRNFRIKNLLEKPIIIYFICLPLLIVSFVGITFILISNISHAKCVKDKPQFILSAVELINIIAIIILLIDTSGIMDTGENWKLNMSNGITISLSIIFLILLFFYNITPFFLHNFNLVLNNYSSSAKLPYKSCIEKKYQNNSVAFFFEKFVTSNVDYVHFSLILFSIIFISYFIYPLKENIKALQNNIKLSLSSLLQNVICDQTVEIISSADKIINLLLTVIFFTIYFAQILLSTYWPLILQQIVELLELVLMLGIVIYILRNITFWLRVPITKPLQIFDLAILWLGILGEQTISIGYLIVVFTKIYYGKNVENYIIDALILIMKLLQSFLQTILISFILQRDFKKNLCRMLYKGLNPFLTLAVLNVIFLIYMIILNIIDYDTKTNEQPLFLKGIRVVFLPLSMLYRVYCVLCIVTRLIL